MNFSTDKFMRGLWEMLDTMKNDFVTDMCDDACVLSRRIVDETNNAKCLVLMNEVSTLASMATNFQHDCKALYDEFDHRFRFNHGEQKHSASRS